ncbi:hypothetical protein F5X96DRAFT_593389 [Biscogniauxia mediterranea]|nr:hypothetical protein F5X96DRAFT_593389 [Biscogniauxia mediterranea]
MAIQNEIERYQYHRAAPYPDTPRYNLSSKGIQTWIQQRTLPERPLPRSLQLRGYYPLHRAPLGSYLSPRTWHKYHKSYSRPIGGCLFEALPKNVMDRICSYVPYEYLLLLRQTSHTIHTLVDPYQAPYHTMIACVLRAERDFAQHRGKAPHNLGCYTCFRVLPAGRFASNQPSQVIVQDRDRDRDREVVVNLRRYCVDCGLRVGYHGPGDFIVRPTGQKSWICRCGDVIHWDDASQCAVCKAICPFRSMAAARSHARRRYDQANVQRRELKIICSLSLQDITGHELV